MNQDSDVIEFAYTDLSSDFDKILSLRPTSLRILPKRFTLEIYPGSFKTVELSNNNEYAQYIYKAIDAGLKSEWFTNKIDATKIQDHKVIIGFINWLNTCKISQDNCYKLLKNYESKRTNVDGVKPQSSGLKRLISLLKAGSCDAQLDQNTLVFISELIKNTKISLPDKILSITLTGFFSSMPWLREVVGEEDYLKIASPKRLIDSFSITVGTTLLFIIEAKKQAQLQLTNPSELQSCKTKNPQYIKISYSSNLLIKLGSYSLSDSDENGSNAQPADDLTRLIFADCVSLDKQDKLLSIWKSHKPGKNFTYRTQLFFTEAHILAATNWNKPSTIEQLLFSWLCATQMVQTADIGKLKRADFAIHRNQHGRPVAIQCSYYKGRSGHVHETPVLEASSIEGMAILAYLNYAESSSSVLCKTFKSIRLSNRSTSISGRLLRLWNDKYLDSLVRENMVKRKCSPIFLRAYNLMLETGSEGFGIWCSKNTTGIEGYKKSVARPLSSTLFGMAAVKTSAVHARTDKYREGDLVNQNSHSNQTEKMHYLTDANKDWVNQNGRITRAVLLDIERYVYRPNLDVAIHQTHDNLLRTRILSALGSGIDSQSEVRINLLGRTEFGREEIEKARIDTDSIIVLDTPETVMNMLHYINEAVRQQDTLILNALSFFERTVLPNVEWMHVVMNRLSPASVQGGERAYKQIQAVLPPLFSNELHAGITA